MDRLLFHLRTRTGDLWVWLGSWQLAIVSMVLAGLFHAYLAIWARSSPSQVVANIAMLAPFWLVYALLLMGTGVCFWRRLGTLRRQLAAEPGLRSGPPDWERATPPGLAPLQARRLVERLGYRARERAGTVRGVRQRWAPLGPFLFHGAFFLVAIGFLATLAARREASVWVAEGEDFTGAAEQFRTQSPPRLADPALPPIGFRPVSIQPEYWRGELLFTRLEAELELPGGRRAVTRINRPLIWDWRTTLRLSGFGFAPRFELLDGEGRVLEQATVKLSVFPPGQRDHFRIPGYPHRFYVEVFPDLELVDGRPGTRTLNLARPAVRLRVVRGRVDLGAGVLEMGEPYPVEGLQIRFPEISRWGEFAIVSDPGAPMLFAGYLLGLVGLGLKLRGPRAEVEWRPEADGGGRLAGWGRAAPEQLLGEDAE